MKIEQKNGFWTVNEKRFNELNDQEKIQLERFFTEMKNEQMTPEKDISEELFQEWRSCMRYGDASRVAKYTGLSQPTITDALNRGIVKQHKTVIAITEFFRNRLEKENQEAEKLHKARMINDKEEVDPCNHTEDGHECIRDEDEYCGKKCEGPKSTEAKKEQK